MLAKSYPDFKVDVVLADVDHVGQNPSGNADQLQDLASASGARLVLAPLAKAQGPSDQHDPTLLASAFSSIFAHGRISPWQ